MGAGIAPSRDGGDVITPYEGVSFSINKDPSTGQVLHRWGHLFLTCVTSDKQEVTPYYCLSRRKKRCPLPQGQLSQWETAMAQPMTSHYTLNLQFPPMDSYPITAPSKSIKEPFLPLSGLAGGSP